MMIAERNRSDAYGSVDLDGRRIWLLADWTWDADEPRLEEAAETLVPLFDIPESVGNPAAWALRTLNDELDGRGVTYNMKPGSFDLPHGKGGQSQESLAPHPLHRIIGELRQCDLPARYAEDPFKSEAQRRWMWANDPEMARRWEGETTDGKDLPERVSGESWLDTWKRGPRAAEAWSQHEGPRGGTYWLRDGNLKTKTYHKPEDQDSRQHKVVDDVEIPMIAAAAVTEPTVERTEIQSFAETLGEPASVHDARDGQLVLDKINQTTGTAWTLQDVAKLCGAMDGAKVFAYDVTLSDAPRLRMDVVGPNYTAECYLLVRDGEPKLILGEIAVEKDQQRKGIGTKLHAQVVAAAERMGIRRILLEAARSSEMNGYYTWPLLGYDAELDLPRWLKRASGYGPMIREKPESITKNIQAATDRMGLPKEGVFRLSDLMRSREGQEIWKRYGGSMSCEFDTRAGSLSRRVFDAYLAKRFPQLIAAESWAELMDLDDDGVTSGPDTDLSPEDEELLRGIWENLGIVEDAGGRRRLTESAPRGRVQVVENAFDPHYILARELGIIQEDWTQHRGPRGGTYWIQDGDPKTKTYRKPGADAKRTDVSVDLPDTQAGVSSAGSVASAPQRTLFDKSGETAPARAPAKSQAELENRYARVADMYRQDAGVSEGYTIGEHTGMVMDMWDRQTRPDELATLSERLGVDVPRVMQTALMLHDIGKPLAIEEGEKWRQHEFTLPIMADVMQQEGFGPREIKLAQAVVGHDIFGDVLKGNLEPSAGAAQLIARAKDAGVDPRAFSELASLYFTADAASYPYLYDKVFREDEGGRLEFKSPAYRELMDEVAAQSRPAEPEAKELPRGSEAVKQHVSTWTPEEKERDWHENGTRGGSFKSFFGDWEHDLENCSKVLDQETGEPKETTEISGEGSKVTDDDGLPKAVYHGTAFKGFQAFDKSKLDPNALYGPGFYFTEDPTVAGGTFEQRTKWEQFETQDEAKLATSKAPGMLRYHEPYKDVATGKWMAPTGYEQHLEKAGYAQKGVPTIQDPEQRKAVRDALLQDLAKRGKGYLSKSEVERVQQDIEYFLGERLIYGQDAKSVVGNLDWLGGLVGQQPYNLNVWDAALQAGIDIQGETKVCYLNIRKPFDLGPERKITEEEGTMLAALIPKPLGNSDEHPDEWSHYEYLVGRLTNREFVEDAETVFQILALATPDKEKRRAGGEPAFAVELLQLAGYDGLTHIGGNRQGGGHLHRVWIAWEPTQIKAKDNRGTFDTTKDNMYESWLARYGTRVALEEWTRYDGPRGGKGWQWNGQGDPVYQDEMPESLDRKAAEPVASWRAAPTGDDWRPPEARQEPADEPAEPTPGPDFWSSTEIRRPEGESRQPWQMTRAELGIGSHRTTPEAARAIGQEGFNLDRFGQGAGFGMAEEPAGIFVSMGTGEDFQKEVETRGLPMTETLEVQIPPGKIWRPMNQERFAEYKVAAKQFVKDKYGLSDELADSLIAGHGSRDLKAAGQPDVYRDWAINPDTEIEFKKAFAEHLRRKGYAALEWTEPIHHVKQMLVLDPSQIRLTNHEAIVRTALKRGLPVPDEVLADYPALENEYFAKESAARGNGSLAVEEWTEHYGPRNGHYWKNEAGTKRYQDAKPGSAEEGQKRSKTGGEIGPNGEWYKGGAFIATTEMPKRAREKRDRAAKGTVYVEPGVRATPEPGKMSIFSLIGEVYNQRDGSINDAAVAFYKLDPPWVRDMVERYEEGDRWVDVTEYPLNARYADLARMAKAGLPIPGEALDQMARFRNESRDELEAGLGVKRYLRSNPPPRDDQRPRPVGKIGSDGTAFQMDVENDRFVHFTTRERAQQILQSGKLLMDPPYRKFGTDSVDAVSLTYGKSLPGVQTSHIESDDLVAVVFRTNVTPEIGYVEEVKWHQDVPLLEPQIVSVEEARKMLDGTQQIGDSDQVVYSDEAAARYREPESADERLKAAGLSPEPRGNRTVVKAEIPMPPQVQTLAAALKLDENVKLYAVGGAVRDFLMNRLHEPGKPYRPKDVDLTTNLSEAEILERLSSPEAAALGIKVKAKESVDTFGVVFANVNGVDFEVAPFRQDIGTADGRRPERVERGTMEQDAARRDLTMNNLYYDFGKGEILDLNPDGQGLRDIAERVTRPVGDPAQRFEEDRLRVLRLVRFFSRFNEGEIRDFLDPQTMAAVEQYRDLPGVTPERIETEFAAGLQKAKSPASYLENYRHLGLLDRTFQGLQVNTEELARVGQTRDRPTVLAWLLRDGHQVRDGLNRLKYSNDVSNRVQFLVDAMNMSPEDAPRIVRTKEQIRLAPNAALAGGVPLSPEKIESLNRQRDEELRGQLLALAAIVPEREAAIRLRHLAVYQPPRISGTELAEAGFSGPEIGREQRRRVEQHYRDSLEAFRQSRLAAESWRRGQGKRLAVAGTGSSPVA